jgi:CubicO group peptidase (beta-lactamase class C family)
MSSVNKNFILLLGCLLLSVCSMGMAQGEEEWKHLKVDKLFKEWDKSNTPGASLAIVKDGQVLYRKGYGMANLEYAIPNTPSTVFHIASISKQFTAFAILLLERDGRVSMDDDIRKYIPEVPNFGKKITLQHLATHTSGLRDHRNLLAMAGWRLDDVITKEHVMKLVKTQKELNFDPGEEYLYCNTGFTLLAEVVARVTGKSFAEFTRTNIFEPLGMNKTLFYDDHEKIVKNRAYSYHKDKEVYKKSVLNYANVGATSLFTTVEDLSIWSRNFEYPTVGNRKLINKMNTPQTLNDGNTISYALGQTVTTYNGLKCIRHSGADAGFRSSLLRFPDQNFSVMAFGNFAEFDATEVTKAIADIYLEEEYTVKDKNINPRKNSKKTKYSSRKKEVNLEEYTGKFYSEELSTTYTFTIKRNQLVAEHSRRNDITLNHLNKDTFDGDAWYFSDIDFTRDANNIITGCKVSSGRVRNLRFIKIGE